MLASDTQPLLITRDYVVIALYFVVIAAIGVLATLRARRGSSRSFFVAERSLPWWMIGFSMVAAGISAEQMLGEVGFARDAGLVTSNWDLGIFPALVLMVFVFLPLYLRSGLTTIPEYLEKRYNPTTRLLFAIYTVFNNACITLVMVLALGVIALEHFLGIDKRLGAILLILATGIYTVYGGMLAVAWTQTLQCVLLLTGGLIITFAGLAKLPGGMFGLFERMGEHNLDHLVRPIDDPWVPWPGLILLLFSTNVWYCCTNQFYVQSCLGAKDERHGRLGILLTAFLAPVLTLCFAFPGYIAADLGRLGMLPVGDDADATYPQLAAYLLGPGWRGFLAAAVIGAIMSSVAAIVNATAGVFTHDLYARWIRPAATDREQVWAGRITGVVTLAVAYPLVLLAGEYKYIFTYSQSAWCILAIPIMLAFTLGALWPRATSSSATATFILILPFVAVPFAWGNTSDYSLTLPFNLGTAHLFNFAFALWLTAAAFMITVSLLTPPPSTEVIATCVWKPRLIHPADTHGRTVPIHQRVTTWTAVAGILIAAIYIYLW